MGLCFPAHVHVTETLLQDLYLLQQPRFSYCPREEIAGSMIQPMSVCRAGFSLETRELFYFSEKKVFKKHVDDLQEQKILEKFVNVMIEPRDFNPLEKAFLTM